MTETEETNGEPLRRSRQQSAGDNAGILDHKNRRHDVGRNRRRYRHHDARLGISGVGTLIFLAALVVLVALQIAASTFRPFLYWATIIASTTAGTTMADFADRSLGIGYVGGSLVLLCVCARRARTLGTKRWAVFPSTTSSRARQEIFYWIAITFSQTLGTALGDWIADSSGLGYLGGAAVFAGAIILVVLAYYATDISRVALFWTAFILTRPLGATVGDFIDKPLDDGGLTLSRPVATLILAAFIIACILFLPQRAASNRRRDSEIRRSH